MESQHLHRGRLIDHLHLVVRDLEGQPALLRRDSAGARRSDVR